MRHHHTAPKDKLCPGCIPEASAIAQAEERVKRRLAWALVGFALALAGVCAFVLLRMGPLR